MLDIGALRVGTLRIGALSILLGSGCGGGDADQSRDGCRLETHGAVVSINDCLRKANEGNDNLSSKPQSATRDNLYSSHRALELLFWSEHVKFGPLINEIE